MEKVILSVDDANKILDYLSKKPYLEVFELIAAIHKSIVKEENNKDIKDGTTS